MRAGEGHDAGQHQCDQCDHSRASLFVAPGGVVTDIETLMEIVRSGDHGEQEHGDTQDGSQPEQAPMRDTRGMSPGDQHDGRDRHQPCEIEQLFQGAPSYKVGPHSVETSHAQGSE